MLPYGAVTKGQKGIELASLDEIKDIIAYLRLINNQDDDVSLLRVINTPKRGIGDKTLENLA